jgi:hypothetical protein
LETYKSHIGAYYQTFGKSKRERFGMVDLVSREFGVCCVTMGAGKESWASQLLILLIGGVLALRGAFGPGYGYDTCIA